MGPGRSTRSVRRLKTGACSGFHPGGPGRGWLRLPRRGFRVFRGFSLPDRLAVVVVHCPLILFYRQSEKGAAARVVRSAPRFAAVHVARVVRPSSPLLVAAAARGHDAGVRGSLLSRTRSLLPVRYTKSEYACFLFPFPVPVPVYGAFLFSGFASVTVVLFSVLSRDAWPRFTRVALYAII